MEVIYLFLLIAQMFLFYVKKGVAFVNGINIGRYWPSVGPQITLYVPALFLIPYPGENSIIMLELEGVPKNLSISLVDKPNINGKVNQEF